MVRSGSQKALLVISILGIIASIFLIFTAAMTLFAGGLIAGEPATVVDGVTNAEAGAMVGFLGAVSLIEGLIILIESILGIRASKDCTKIGPVWVLAIIGIILAAIDLILFFTGNSSSDLASLIISLLFSILYFWICNNIKTQAEMLPPLP